MKSTDRPQTDVPFRLPLRCTNAERLKISRRYAGVKSGIRLTRTQTKMRCTSCGSLLRKTDRREEMVDLEEDATDGQQADYLAAELSGDHGAWNVGIVEYQCPNCRRTIEVQQEILPDYKELILGWHQKATNEGDYFSRFVFEYLAFIAHLKNNLYFEQTSDRNVIQSLKRDRIRQAWYTRRTKSDKQLLRAVQNLLKELKEHPLHNSSFDLVNPEIDKWWNSIGPHPSTDETIPKGLIRSEDDRENLVEFWYSVRNNLFHGGKNPNVRRDCFLVEHAYKTLKVFMEVELNLVE